MTPFSEMTVARFRLKWQAQIAHPATARKICFDQLQGAAAGFGHQGQHEHQRCDTDQAVEAECPGDADAACTRIGKVRETSTLTPQAVAEAMPMPGPRNASGNSSDIST